jgi:TolB-like protein/Flp pilus assembly protein TadD
MLNLVQELKKRNVIRAAVAYVLVAWTIAQVAELGLDSFDASPLIMQTLLIVLLAGLPITVVLAWVYEITPDGIHKDEDVDRSAPAYRQKGRKFDLIIIGLLTLALSYFVVDKIRNRIVIIEADSIAVLPLANRSSDEGSQYFADGIHDELLTQLGHVSDLTVISRTSVQEYRETTKKASEIAKELGVTTLLEGSVRRSGDRVRIAVTLIDATQDKHLWSEKYDRLLSPANIFEIQSEIADTIAVALTANLAAAHTLPVLDRPITDSQEAYDLYLRAKAKSFDGPMDELFESIELATRAVEIDPNFAVAMGLIAEQYANLYWFYSQQEEHLDKARQWIDKALVIEPDDPRLQLGFSNILYQGYLDYNGALVAARKAERGMPSNSRVYLALGSVLRRSGRIEEAIEAYKKAQILNPRDVQTFAHHIFTFMFLGDVAGARTQAELIMALPQATPIHIGYTKLIDLYMLGDTDALRDYLQKRPDVNLGSELHLKVMLPFFERRYTDVLKALESQPDPVIAQFKLLTHSAIKARVLHAQGNYDAAREEATIAVSELTALAETMPNNARPIVTRALMHAILGDVGQTRADVNLSASLYPIEDDPVDGPAYVADGLRALALILNSAELADAMDDYLSLRTKLYYVDFLLLDPVFDQHRADPDIKALIERFSLRSATTN